ncbi:hypothetical protein [Rhodoflexus caldus]|uniref:hypothetical protein n=1 Tax=Rhodoflexus caldus TaxID=2891236 RepID=UPI00202A5BC2|nr:hypothetical protein [Rhodoflexus caldus]
MKRLYLSFSLVLMLACGANTPESNTQQVVNNAPDAASEAALPQISDDLVANIMQSIPSPIETSFLIKGIGAPYNVSNLNDHNLVTNYNTNYSQALNLGVYSTDLGFANLYDKNQDVLNYLNAVKKLADNLGIGQYFDYKTIKELASSSGNVEQLLQLTQQNLEKIHNHLNEQKRESLTILILTGGWVEALYLTTLVNQKANNKELRDRIGEQKIALEQILTILDVYKTKPNFATLIADLKELNKIYSKVQIKTTVGKPTQKVVNGEIITEDNTVSTIIIQDADVQAITSMVKSIRNKIIKS